MGFGETMLNNSENKFEAKMVDVHICIPVDIMQLISVNLYSQL